MLILAVESSSRIASIAIFDNQKLLVARTLPHDLGTAQALAPTIHACLRELSATCDQLDLIAVTTGPGSFTGLRIGVTTAKTLAYATGADILGLNTLTVIAEHAPSHCAQLEVVIDAQRNQVFNASFDRDENGELRARQEARILDNTEWLAQLSSDTWITGPGLKRLSAECPNPSRLLPAEEWQPQAARLGQLAYQRHASGERHDLWSLVPQYFRPSAAEEKL